MPSKNDVAWEQLFQQYDIVAHIDRDGVYEISSRAINQVREARLMTKFDHRIQLPAAFKQNNLTIQPNSRGTYLIGRFESYYELPLGDDVEVEQVTFPPGFHSINPQDLYSESAAILCAYNSRIMERLLGEPVSLTVMGRMSTERFNYEIDEMGTGQRVQIQVNNSQCEIDSGFEGQNIFAILEAKNETVNDFLIRQLYYPYRLWSGRMPKQVVPIFLSYSNEVFSFYVFRFIVDGDYNSIELVEQTKYQIAEREIELAEIVNAAAQIEAVPEPIGVPFPQADSFNRVVDLLTQLHAAGTMSQEEITTNHAFDVRQTQYYTNAGRYLGLVESRRTLQDGVTYSLTPVGAAIMSRPAADRNRRLVERILQHGVFNEAVRLYLDHARRPDLAEVVANMRGAGLGLDNTTIRRRAQTVLGWVDWIIRLTRR